MLRSALTALSICFGLVLTFIFNSHVPDAQATLSNNIVISELEVFGATANDEFVELYNPTANDILLTGWRLTRKTSTGAESNLVSSLSGTIKSHGYYLITPQTGYIGSPSADKAYSVANSVLAANNTVLLYSDAGITLIDKIGIGTALDKEGEAIANPLNGSSIERKADSASTVDSMTSGIDVLMGNGEDTGSNQNDFVARLIPQPQNSQANLEPVEASPSPTEPEPSATETITPTPTAIYIPTSEPTPSMSPTPTTTPNETPSPTPIQSGPTPTKPQLPAFPKMTLSCTTKTVSLRFMSLIMEFQYPFCTLVKITN